MGGMKPAEIRFSLQRSPQHRDPGMAPKIPAAINSSEEHLTLTHKVNQKLMKFVFYKIVSIIFSC